MILSRTAIRLVLCIAGMLAVADGWAGDLTNRTANERHLLGERMYREGLLPSGAPMQAYVKKDTPVPGTSFTCVSCHLRSGLGSVEGGVFTPPTNGKYLFSPQKSINLTKYAKFPAPRPVYTESSLAALLRGGVDPSGRVLDDIMPRYYLNHDDMALLVDYLKSLSNEFSPGVTNSTLRFATVITDDVPRDKADLMFAALERYLQHKNNMVRSYENDPRKSRMAEAMLISREAAFKRITLSRWQLKGPPDSWRRQLEEYYRREPVFALLGGGTTGDWKPVHQFSEDNRIPCILPMTPFPVISESDWYTLYFSKGTFLEGEAAARYLNRLKRNNNDSAAVQIVQDTPAGRALEKGFNQMWEELGNPAIPTVMLRKDAPITVDALRAIVTAHNAATALLWLEPEHMAAIGALASSQRTPARIIVSSSGIGTALTTLDDQTRDTLMFAYPYRLPQDEASFDVYIEAMAQQLHASDEPSRMIVKRSYIIYQILSQALSALKGNYYRDGLLDMLGMTMSMGGMGLNQDLVFPLYERISFGPGQRYASKGCYMVQLTKGASPKLVRQSEWVVH